MDPRHPYEARPLRTHRVNIVQRPKSAHISHRGELVLNLSPRINRFNVGVNDPPSKWHQEQQQKRIVQRYCVLDHTVQDEDKTDAVNEVTVEKNTSPKVTRAGTLFQKSSEVQAATTTGTPVSSVNNNTVLPPAANDIASKQNPSTPTSAWGDKKEALPAPTSRIEAKSPSKCSSPKSTSKPCIGVLCHSAQLARKQAEESARLLANRLSYLQMERAKAEQDAEKIQVELMREQEAKEAFERQKIERAFRAEAERKRLEEKQLHTLNLQRQNRANIQLHAQYVAQQKRDAVFRLKQQQKALEEAKKTREENLYQERMRTKHTVASQHERTKRARLAKERMNKEKQERAQADRLRRELDRENCAKHLVAKMQAQENTLKGILEFQEQQQRIELQRCLDIATHIVPDEMT